MAKLLKTILEYLWCARVGLFRNSVWVVFFLLFFYRDFTVSDEALAVDGKGKMATLAIR